MTLLVVHNNRVFTDSRVVMGDHDALSTKVHHRYGVTYACAGSAEACETAMLELSASGWFEPVKSIAEDPEHTFVVALIDNQLYQLDLARVTPRFAPVNPPTKTGLHVMAGTGWRWFHAYFLEHGDITKAFELAATYCRDVALPMQSFGPEETSSHD